MKRRALNDFEAVAKSYDFLKRVVFGKRLDEASKSMLHMVWPGSNVLILGGGTGKLMEELPDCHITFVEKSLSMMELAKKRRTEGVTFVHADFLTCQLEGPFDYIICPFFLDVLNDLQLKTIFDLMKDQLHESGKLLVIDFQVLNKWHLILTKVMYGFFAVVAKLEARRLIDLHGLILSHGFKMERELFHSKGFVFSRCYNR